MPPLGWRWVYIAPAVWWQVRRMLAGHGALGDGTDRRHPHGHREGERP